MFVFRRPPVLEAHLMLQAIRVSMERRQPALIRAINIHMTQLLVCVLPRLYVPQGYTMLPSKAAKWLLFLIAAHILLMRLAVSVHKMLLVLMTQPSVSTPRLHLLPRL